MQTKVFKIDENSIDINQLRQASNLIKDGQLVAIPTETVYGLAADGLNPVALRKVFEAKNRPMDNPLILHISKLDEIFKLVKEVKDSDLEILKKLWPGPLTVILKKSDIIPDEVSAGLDTVAIRMPDKLLTRDFIEMCQVPLAAPSANLSTKPSPTRAEDVLEDMDGRIAGVIDGGPSYIGLESTVLDLTSEIPLILRPGFYTKEDLEYYWPQIGYDMALKNENQTPKAPGQKYKHYAPKARVEVYIGSSEAFKIKAEALRKQTSGRFGLMYFDQDGPLAKADLNISMGDMADLSTMGKILFTSLREMDNNNIDLVVVHGVLENSYGLSIMNRLKKSASGRVYYLED